MSTLVILGFAALGIGAAIAAFLKSPKESRYGRPLATSLEDQLKALPAAAQAVIIKANKSRKRVLAEWALMFVVAVPGAGFVLWLKHAAHPECTRVLGLNAAYLGFLLACYGPPLVLLALSLAPFRSAIKTLRTGYFPPLDSTVARDTIARKGIASTSRAVLFLLMPFIALFFLYILAGVQAEIFGGKSTQEITQKFEAKCPVS